MKELSIEEKAKRYDEALSVAKGLYAKGAPDSLHLERMFPELKESEDEKIRKDIIIYLQYAIAFDKSFFNKKYNWSYKDCSKWIAWLEKQGEQETLCDKCRKEQPSHSCQDITSLGRCAVEHEQKPDDKVEPKFKVGDTVKDPYGDLYHITEIIDDSYKTDDGRFILFENQEVYTLSNFTAWSEEDEIKIKSIIAFLKSPALCCMENNKGIIDANIKYLKSLRDRVQPQPKQEWSEEDEHEVAILEAYIRSNDWSEAHIDRALGIVDELVNKVKSIKPQPTWKPSKEQMMALQDISLTGNISYTGQGQLLIDLYNDLKNYKNNFEL